MKFSISVPDATKPSIRVSGIKLDKNPFMILGKVVLKNDETVGGHRIYKVIETDFPTCFPLNEYFWNITDMFCNACNRNIHTYGGDYLSSDFTDIRHSSNFPIFSKHKYDDGWLILIYSPNEVKFDEPVTNLMENRINKFEFYTE